MAQPKRLLLGAMFVVRLTDLQLKQGLAFEAAPVLRWHTHGLHLFRRSNEGKVPASGINTDGALFLAPRREPQSGRFCA